MSRANRGARRFAASLRNLGNPTPRRGQNSRVAGIVASEEQRMVEEEQAVGDSLHREQEEQRLRDIIAERTAADLETVTFSRPAREAQADPASATDTPQSVGSQLQAILIFLGTRESHDGDIRLSRSDSVLLRGMLQRLAGIDTSRTTSISDNTNRTVRILDRDRGFAGMRSFFDQQSFFSRESLDRARTNLERATRGLSTQPPLGGYVPRSRTPTPEAPKAVIETVRLPKRSVNGFMIKEVRKKDGTVLRVVADSHAQSTGSAPIGEVQDSQPPQEKASEPAPPFPYPVSSDQAGGIDSSSAVFTQNGRVIGRITNLGADGPAPDSVRDTGDQA